MSLGGHGVVSVVGNLVPGRMVALVEAAASGDFEAARKIHYELLDLFKASFIETNPVPIKEAMNLCGLNTGSVRDRKSTRLNSSHVAISYAVFCLKKKRRTAKTRTVRRNNTNRI